MELMNFDVMHRIKNEVMLHREREAHGLGAFRHHAVQRAGVNRLRHAHFKNLNGLTLTERLRAQIVNVHALLT